MQKSVTTLASSGKAPISVRTIFLSDGTRFTIRSARSTRTARSTVRLPLSGKTTRIHAEPTTKKSKVFHASAK